jgi:hypothetical protein
MLTELQEDGEGHDERWIIDLGIAYSPDTLRCESNLGDILPPGAALGRKILTASFGLPTTIGRLIGPALSSTQRSIDASRGSISRGPRSVPATARVAISNIVREHHHLSSDMLVAVEP